MLSTFQGTVEDVFVSCIGYRDYFLNICSFVRGKCDFSVSDSIESVPFSSLKLCHVLNPLRLSAESLHCFHTCGQRASLSQLLMHSLGRAHQE